MSLPPNRDGSRHEDLEDSSAFACSQPGSTLVLFWISGAPLYSWSEQDQLRLCLVARDELPPDPTIQLDGCAIRESDLPASNVLFYG